MKEIAIENTGSNTLTTSAWLRLAMLVLLPLSGLAAPSWTHAQAPDIRDLRPVMLLLVDTSGSMERLPNCTCTTSTCSECNPNCGVSEKNRWSMVVEAMTGEFTSFSCTQQPRTTAAFSTEPDYNYVIPHHDITSSAQLTNGVLDAYKERIRFGLMTFDGIETLRTAGMLVPQSNWTPTFLTDSGGALGQYSYGDVKQLYFPGCATVMAVDNGMRSDSPVGGAGVGEVPGNMVSVGDTADYLLINQRIQDSLLEIRPFGPTPVAGMLDDLQFYLENHPDVRPVSGGVGDPFANCRTRYAVLITDGKPNADFRDTDLFGGGTCEMGSPYICPYPTPETMSSTLCDMDASGDCTGDLDGLFVVGFNVSGDPATVARLNGLADLGGTGDLVRDVTGGTDGALFADDISTLRSALSAVLDASAAGTTTRTAPAFAAGGGVVSNAQFQFNTGFRQAPNPGDPWEGVLERKRFVCNGTAVEEKAVDGSDRFHEVVTAMASSTRKIYTVVPQLANLSGWVTGSGASQMVSDGLPLPTSTGSSPLETGLGVVAFTESNIPLSHLGVSTAAERTAIVDFIRGVGRSNALSDIYHSTPVVVAAPTVDRPDEAFNLYRKQVQVEERPTVLYFGTNDGVLHAVAAEDYNNGTVSFNAGTELFAFVPPGLFQKLDSARTSHQAMLDGSPVVKDVFIARRAGAVPDADQYRTILVVGFRGGGAGYFALDVTDPIDAMNNGPDFLWQFSDALMGDSYGTPGIAQVLNDASGTNERAVAILPGGAGTPLAGTCLAQKGVTAGLTSERSNRRCWGPKGRAAWVVDLYSGELIKSFTTGIDSPLTGGAAVFNGEVGAIASRAFMSDQDGMIWRLDVASSDPDDWSIDPFHDVFYNEADDFGEPAYNAPVLTINSAGEVVLLQATGDVDVLDGTTQNRVVSLTEKVTFDSSGNYDPASDVAGVLNWEEVLQAGEQVTGPLALFAGTVYFGTFHSQASATDACEFGYSRIFGMGYLDQSPAFEISPGVFSTFQGPFTNQIVMGVSITQEPSCFVGAPDYDPYVGNYYKVTNQGGGGFKLRAQVAGGGSAASGGTVAEIDLDLETPDFFTRVEARASSVD